MAYVVLVQGKPAGSCRNLVGGQIEPVLRYQVSIRECLVNILVEAYRVRTRVCLAADRDL
jgi:hypothetical protein